MNKAAKDRKLILASIEHWERMRNATKKTIGDEAPEGEQCSLCKEYALKDDTSYNCKHCPVYLATKEKHCIGTPFEFASIRFVNWFKHGGSIHKWRRAADVEIAFLKSLL